MFLFQRNNVFWSLCDLADSHFTKISKLFQKMFLLFIALWSSGRRKMRGRGSRASSKFYPLLLLFFISAHRHGGVSETCACLITWISWIPRREMRIPELLFFNFINIIHTMAQKNYFNENLIIYHSKGDYKKKKLL